MWATHQCSKVYFNIKFSIECRTNLLFLSLQTLPEGRVRLPWNFDRRKWISHIQVLNLGPINTLPHILVSLILSSIGYQSMMETLIKVHENRMLLLLTTQTSSLQFYTNHNETCIFCEILTIKFSSRHRRNNLSLTFETYFLSASTPQYIFFSLCPSYSAA
jgi:hypothetical protein